MLHKGSANSGRKIPETNTSINHKKTRSRKRKGFSLIELLVTVGIIGVLSAVAIPAYNSYRQDAAKSAIISSLNSVAKAFAACLTLKTWTECNSVSKMNVSCPGCDPESASSTSYCTNVSNQVGSNTFTGCVQTNGEIPLIVGNWPILCSKVDVIHTCNSTGNGYDAPGTTCANYGCKSPAPAPTIPSCLANVDTAPQNCGTGDTNGTQPVACSGGLCG